MGYSLRTINSGEKILLSRGLMEAIASAFVGVLVLLICQAMHLGNEWTGAIVGMAGWLGANATIQIIERIARKRLGLDPKPQGDAE